MPVPVLPVRIVYAVGVVRVEAEKVGQDIGTELGLAQLSGIQAAVTENVRIIEAHRKDISALKSLTLVMAKELEGQSGSEAQHSIEELIRLVGENDPLAAASLEKALSLSKRSMIIDKLTNALIKLVAAERQAYNIDDEGKGGGNLESVLEELRQEEGL